MRNDVIERTVNDSIITIADYLLQMIEQAKRQRELDMRNLIDKSSIGMQKDFPHLSLEDRMDAEYEVYYALIKERQQHLFEVKGKLVETFPVDKTCSFQVFQDMDKFYGVFRQVKKDAHRVTEHFQSLEEVVRNTFGAQGFEIFRSNSFFEVADGKAFSIKDNKQFRLNLIEPFRVQTVFENMEQARLSVVKEELKNDPKLRKQAFKKVLNEYDIPSELSGKKITLKKVSDKGEGIELSIEVDEKERHIRIPDLAGKWLERLSEQPRIKVVFDEFMMDSRAIGEGFLSFYGIELNKEIQKKQHDFEIISNKHGSYIGKLNGNGKVKKVSPYFSNTEEAQEQLKNLKNYIRIEKEKERLLDNGQEEPSIEITGMVEKNKEE